MLNRAYFVFVIVGTMLQIGLKAVDTPIINAPIYARMIQQFKDRQLAQVSRIGDIIWMQKWLKAGANPNARDELGFPAIYNAVMSGNRGAIHYLLNMGANPNAFEAACDNKPLHYAAAQGLVAMTKLLLDRGADPRMRNDFEKQPADVATCNQIKCMLTKKAVELDAMDKDKF